MSPGYFINLWTVLFQPGKTRTCKNFFPPVAIFDGLVIYYVNVSVCVSVCIYNDTTKVNGNVLQTGALLTTGQGNYGDV